MQVAFAHHSSSEGEAPSGLETRHLEQAIKPYARARENLWFDFLSYSEYLVAESPAIVDDIHELLINEEDARQAARAAENQGLHDRALSMRLEVLDHLEDIAALPGLGGVAREAGDRLFDMVHKANDAEGPKTMLGRIRCTDAYDAFAALARVNVPRAVVALQAIGDTERKRYSRAVWTGLLDSGMSRKGATEWAKGMAPLEGRKAD